MSAAARSFWLPKITKDIQAKCDDCIPCRMTGKSIKPQIPMTEINYLPLVEKPNQEIQLDFVGPIRFKHRRFYILVSIDRYSRWPAACICEAPNGRTAKTFLEQYILLNGIPQLIRTDKGTAFTGTEFRQKCKSLSMKLIYGTPYIHTATGLVERGIKTLKHLMRAYLEDKCNVHEALHSSLMVMRTTVHSKIKETPFERHYGRKPRTEVTSFLNLPTNVNKFISAHPETLQVNSFANGKDEYDQLIMKTPRKLKCDVSNKFPYQFLEMKQNKNKFESKYETKPQTAVAGTKHTITTDTNKTIHRKLISKPLPNTFQNSLSRRGENRRGPDGRFATQTETSETTTVEEEEKESDSGEDQTSSQAADVSMESVEANFEFTSPKQPGRGRKKPSPSTPGRSNLRLHVDVMTEEQLEQAMQTINENPTTTTIVDNTGNQNKIKTETNIIENEIPDITENDNQIQIRRSSRKRSNNPIIRFGNPITH